MAKTEASKRWDAAHLKTMSCRLKIEEYDAFVQYAKERGETPAAAVRRLIHEALEEK